MTNAEKLKALVAMSRQELDEVHAGGECPDPDDLQELAQGKVFNLPLMSPFRLWKGKVFQRNAEGQVSGLNRIGVEPLEIRRYRFVVRIGDSAFGDRRVAFLDHDLDGNPYQYRIFHDELIKLQHDLCLASSHVRRKNGSLKYVCHFALDFS